MLQIPFFGSRIYVSLRHIWACQFCNQGIQGDPRGGGGGGGGIPGDPRTPPPPPPLSFFSKRKIFRSSSGDIYFFHSTLLIFSGYKDIEETKIICTNLSNLSGAIVLWGKVSLKSQPSPPLTHGGRGGERWRLLALLLVFPFTSSVATQL